ncbi:MAG: hypothetical protein ACLR8Y_11460 [Alistipes indistinctus]
MPNVTETYSSWTNQFDFKFLQDIASNFGSNNRYLAASSASTFSTWATC